MLQDFDIKIPMNNEEYKNKLNELGVWQYDEVSSAGTIKKVEIDVIDEDRWDYDEELDSESEPEEIPSTGPLGIRLHLKQDPKPCESCKKLVTNRSITAKKSISISPHWRVKCITCDMYKNPWTNEFNVPKTISHDLYNFWASNDNRTTPGPSRFSKYYNK